MSRTEVCMSDCNFKLLYIECHYIYIYEVTTRGGGGGGGGGATSTCLYDIILLCVNFDNQADSYSLKLDIILYLY